MQQLYPHGLGRVAKGQVHPFLINMGGVQPHAMYPVETPPVNFAADEDTKGRYYGLLGVFFHLAAWHGDESRWHRKDAIIPNECCVIEQTALPHQ